MKRAFEILFDRFENNIMIFVLINLTVGILFFTLCHYFPYFADDYHFRLIIGTEDRVRTVKDAVISSWAAYNNKYGRMIPAFLISVMQLSPKTLYNFVNSIFFLLLANLVHKHALRGKFSNSYLILIYLGFWFCLNSFGLTVLWMSCSIEYMWASALALLFLTPYNKSVNVPEKTILPNEKPCSIIFSAIFLFLGLIICSFNEIVGIGTCAFIFAILSIKLFSKYISKMQVKISGWEITGFIGAVMGSAFVSFPPSNFNRMAAANAILPEQPIFVLEIIYRFLRTTYYSCSSLWPLIMLFLLLALIYREENKALPLKQFVSTITTSTYYFFSVLASIYIFVFSKGFSTRFLVFPIAMLLIAAGIIYSRLNLGSLGKKLITIVVFFVITFAALQYVTGLYQMRDPDTVLDARTVYTRKTSDPWWELRQN